jgi:hypothetical protein
MFHPANSTPPSAATLDTQPSPAAATVDNPSIHTPATLEPFTGTASATLDTQPSPAAAAFSFQRRFNAAPTSLLKVVFSAFFRQHFTPRTAPRRL